MHDEANISLGYTYVICAIIFFIAGVIKIVVSDEEDGVSDGIGIIFFGLTPFNLLLPLCLYIAILYCLVYYLPLQLIMKIKQFIKNRKQHG